MKNVTTVLAASLFVIISVFYAASSLTQQLPEKGSWAQCTEIPWRVQEVYGAARDGKAIIVGGMAVADDGTVDILDRVGIYDPLNNSWTEGPRLPSARHHPLVVHASGRIYALGGFTRGDAGIWQARREVHVLDRQGVWASETRMPEIQTEAMAVELGGRIHIIGGRTPTSDNTSRWGEYRDVDWHQVYDIQSRSWSKAAPLPSPRNSAAIAVIDGQIYVAGGRSMKGGNTANLDRYDPMTDSWHSMNPMPYAGGGLNGAVVGGMFYVFGGEELGIRGAEGVLPHAVRYDPATDQWERLADMPAPRHGHAVVSIAATLFVIGGGAHTAGGLTTATLQAFNPPGKFRQFSCGK